jgi:coenzyme PQQ biosynthesis protein C
VSAPPPAIAPLPYPPPPGPGELLSPERLEERLRAVGAARYHDQHPFHALLREGKLSRGQLQAWALNRCYYQSRIPLKDAAFLARAEDPALRREWRRRLEDHDGSEQSEGGFARWLRLCEGLGVRIDPLQPGLGVLPATRFAVEAYVRFVRDASLLEAIAASLTELFSPRIIARRVEGMLAHYDFVSRETLAYFTARLSQAPRDSDFALGYCKEHARTPEQQAQVIAALELKCDVLWAMQDALYFAYVSPGFVPPGCFQPADLPARPQSGSGA